MPETFDNTGRPQDAPATTPAEQSFARRTLIAAGIVLGLAALLLLLWYSMHVLLLAFAAVLVAVLLRGAGEWVAGKAGVATGWGVGIVILALAAFFIVLGVFVAPGVVQQVETLTDRLPRSFRKAEENLGRYSWGRRLLGDPTPNAAPPSTAAGARGDAAAAGPDDASPDAVATQPTSQPSTRPTLVSKVVEAGTGAGAIRSATRIVNQVVQGAFTVLVVVVTGIYLAAQPRVYIDGLLMLAPHARRDRYREVLGRLAQTLRWWMMAQLVPMSVIGTLTAIGLRVIGIDLWFILGLLAGLFNFIPNFGPLISGVPAFLLALAESPTKAMWVVGLYVVAQSLEGYVLTPLVQRRALEMPPALLILFQVLAGLLLGALGVILAAPLLAAVIVAIKMLYVEDVLGDDARVPGEGGGAPG